MKQQFMDPFVIPNLAGFSVGIFEPGQNILPPHAHETMHELFYVLEGKGVFQINGINYAAEPGSFFHMAPNEPHAMWVADNSTDGPMKVIVTAVTIGDKKKKSKKKKKKQA